jgi:hypothetical protein
MARAPVREVFAGDVRRFFIIVLIATMGWFYSYYILLQLAPVVLKRVLNIDPATSGLILTAMAAVDAIGSLTGGAQE